MREDPFGLEFGVTQSRPPSSHSSLEDSNGNLSAFFQPSSHSQDELFDVIIEETAESHDDKDDDVVSNAAGGGGGGGGGGEQRSATDFFGKSIHRDDSGLPLSQSNAPGKRDTTSLLPQTEVRTVSELCTALNIRAEIVAKLESEDFDLDVIMISSDEDFKDIGLPKGVRMKILKWATTQREIKKNAGATPTTTTPIGTREVAFVGEGEKAFPCPPSTAAKSSPTRSRLSSLGVGLESTGSGGSRGRGGVGARGIGARGGGAGGRSHRGAIPDVPDKYCCPISHFIMEDPVTLRGGKFVHGKKEGKEENTPSHLSSLSSKFLYFVLFFASIDGHTYERKDITAWLQQSRTSPMTGIMLNPQDCYLSPNAALKLQIVQWTSQNGFNMAM